MKILILTQLFPMGNYLLNEKIAQYFRSKGHEVNLIAQYYYVSSEIGFAQYVNNLIDFSPDLCYYEMLDRDTFNAVSFLKCEKILVLASLGIYSNLSIDSGINEIIKNKGKHFTKIYTNSTLLVNKFENIVPTKHFKFYFSPINNSTKLFDEEYNYDLVFLGMGFQRTKIQSLELSIFFNALKNYKNFAIYGDGWNKSEFPCYKGKLPRNDIGRLYTSAKGGIAMIQSVQAELGMINNRYIEMLSCGLPIYSLYYPNVDFYGADKFIGFVDRCQTIKNILDNKEFDLLYNYHEVTTDDAKKFAKNMSVEFFQQLDELINI